MSGLFFFALLCFILALHRIEALFDIGVFIFELFHTILLFGIERCKLKSRFKRVQ